MAIRFRRSLLRTLPLLLALAGCEPASPDEAGPALVSETADIRIANSLTTQALVLNAISTNPTANGLLATNKLSTLFAPVGGSTYLRRQLRDPDAQKFMEYLVGCALATGQNLSWFDPLTSSTQVWHGSAGLCPEWATLSPPSDACLNRVSACILARNNAQGRRVELSLRGEVWGSPGVFSLEPVTVPADHDPNTSQRLASVDACAVPTQGASRDCGWRLDAIGRCQPGAPVSVGAGGAESCPGPALGSTTGARTVLRVCEGTVGCDSGAARFLDESAGSCAGTDPVVTFTCPADGYFSVMEAPWDSATTGSANVAVTSTWLASYGLSEAQVFGVREGAFYGNLFNPDALGAHVEVREGKQGRYEVVGKDAVVKGSVYKEMYSCYDPGWQNGAAYATHRVCALPSSGSNCAATVVGSCWNPSVPSASKCATQDGSQVWGDGDFEACRDTGGEAWMEPVTVFLHHPCDVSTRQPPELCMRQTASKTER